MDLAKKIRGGISADFCEKHSLSEVKISSGGDFLPVCGS